jgi:hypothetical protein
MTSPIKKFLIFSVMLISLAALYWIIQFPDVLTKKNAGRAQFESQWLNIYGELSGLLNKSNLFEKSNLSLLPYSQNAEITIDLKETALDNQDTLALCKIITEKYKTMTDHLTQKEVQKLRDIKINFRITSYQDCGPLFSWVHGELREDDSVKQKIILARQNKTLAGLQVKQEKESKLMQAKAAYGALEFGDSEATIKNKLEKECALDSEEICKVTIGSEQYILQPNFYHNKLYSIFIYAHSKNANYFNTIIKDEWQNLVDVVSLQYPESNRINPSLFNGSYPSFLKMRPGHVDWSHAWKFETKEIWIGVGEGAGEEENTYYACLYITDKPTEDRMREDKRAIEQSEKKESSEKF